jgi:hypothetical protein
VRTNHLAFGGIFVFEQTSSCREHLGSLVREAIVKIDASACCKDEVLYLKKDNVSYTAVAMLGDAPIDQSVKEHRRIDEAIQIQLDGAYGSRLRTIMAFG